jgi:hypothetical protein
MILVTNQINESERLATDALSKYEKRSQELKQEESSNMALENVY